MALHTQRIPPAWLGSDEIKELGSIWSSTVRAPLRRLWPMTLFAGIVIGMSVGLSVGVPTNQVTYYFFKETLLGMVGGIFAPLFLWLGRRAYRRWGGRAEESRAVGNLLSALSGALAGCMMLPLHLVLPPLFPIGPWLVFYPLGTAALFPIIAWMVDYIQLQHEEHRQTKVLFGKYVSESVARRILEERNPIPLAGERRRCTVLFSDIRGFTRMVKELGPEEVVRTLNEYFARMIDIVFQFDGTVNKFVGDGMVVLYGAPLALGDEALRAVQTARQMQEALEAINRERAAAGRLPIQIGIGIDSGDVVVGNIGSTRRLEYTAIGSAVNTAFHLGSLAPPRAVLLTENVYRELGTREKVEPWHSVELKDGTGEVMVYTLHNSSGGE